MTEPEEVKPRTQQEVQRLVSEFGASGLSRGEFCRIHGMTLSTLRRGLRRERTQVRPYPKRWQKAVLSCLFQRWRTQLFPHKLTFDRFRSRAQSGGFYKLYFAGDFVLPVALAILMNLLLLPLVGFLNKKARIPEAIGAALAMAALIVVLVGLASLIYQPAASFLQDLPNHLHQIQGRVTFFSASLKEAGHTSDQVQQLMGSTQASPTVVTLKG